MLSISVALCSFNGERFIAEQLLSILGQTQPPQQIVLSDDASADATVELARETVQSFLARHPNMELELRVLENASPLGVTRNFEQAIAACTSELVALSDQDDVWAPDRLAKVGTVFLERPELLLLHSDARLVDEAGAVLPGTLLDTLEVSADVRHAIHAGNAFDALMRRNLVTGATTVIRRSLFDRATPFPESWVHDEWLAIVAAAFDGLELMEETLIDYRQHGSNQIGVSRLSFFGKLSRMLEPGSVRNRRLLGRATALVDRFESMGEAVPQHRVEATHRKLEHERLRSRLSSHRVMRLVPLVRELRTGRYAEFGRGGLDVVRDLVQPLNTAR